MDFNQKLNKTGYVGINLGERKNDYKDGGTFFGLFHSPKINLSYKTENYETLNENNFFKGYHDTERFLETYNFFKSKDDETLDGELICPWKTLFAHGRTIHQKGTTTEEIKSNLNDLIRLKPDEFGNMLPENVK